MAFFSATDPKVELIKSVPVFQGSSRKELEKLSSQMDEITVRSGTTLIREGLGNHAFYILVEGEAEVWIDGKSVATLRAGDHFGEISMMDHSPATATVVTSSETTLLALGHGQFRDAVRSNDAIDARVQESRDARVRSNSDSAGLSG